MDKGIENTEDKVWVTLERTINLGNYESIKLIVGQSQTIKPKDNPQELIEDISESLFATLLEKGRDYKKVLTPKKKIRRDD